MSNFLNFAGNQGMTFKTFTAAGGPTTTTYILDKSASTNSVLVSVGGVMQQPSVDYSVSGTTLTSTSVWTAGVQVDTFIIHKPGTAPTIQDNSIDSDHYVDGSIDTAHIAANQIDSTLTKDAFVGDFTEVTAVAGDSVLLGDASDSGNTKRDTIQGILDLVPSAGFTLGTEAAATGTSVGFTGIPSGTKQIIITFEEIVCSGSSNDLIVEIGDAGGLETSGYVGIGARISDANRATSTSYYAIHGQSTGATSGHFVLTLSDSSNNTWIASHTFRNADNVFVGGGAKSLGVDAPLTQVRIDPGGAQSFSSGAFNVQYIS